MDAQFKDDPIEEEQSIPAPEILEVRAAKGNDAPPLASPDLTQAPTGDEAPRSAKQAQLRVVPLPPLEQDRPAPQIASVVPVARRRPVAAALLSKAKRLATLAVVLLAALISLLAWDHYLTAPWTRDGRVRVQVSSVASEVSGRIKELRVADNQFVKKGEVLYVIDPFDFELALKTSQATLQQRAADLQVKQRQSERKGKLSSLATTPEQQQISAGNAIQAGAAFDAAQYQVVQAEINLKRTEVRSPVNGYVTNLLLRVGDYARQGVTNVSVIDTDSFWIDGYFEETKMAHVCIGASVEAKLIGYAAPIIGHVSTVTRGLSVSNATAGAQGLPNVDPVYTWVRLAQRVPVRIAIDDVPAGVPLVSGMTATVTVREPTAEPVSLVDSVKASVLNVFNGPSARSDCISTDAVDGETTQSIPAWEAYVPVTPEEINPGLATSLLATPRRQ